MDNQLLKKISVIIIIVFVLAIGLSVVASQYNLLAPFLENNEGLSGLIAPVIHQSGAEAIKSFASEQDFKNYLAKASEAQSVSSGAYGRGGGPAMKSLSVGTEAGIAPQAMDNAAPSSVGTGGGTAARVSDTNVQVAGIDEPDIVKTDGQNIYTSSENYFRYYGSPILMEKGVSGGGSVGVQSEIAPIMPPNFPQETTKIIKAFPPKELAKIGKIDNNGTLLLAGNILVIFTPQSIFGYDISDVKNPSQKWTIKLQSNSSASGIRKYGDKIYMIVQNQINYYHPCPIEPLTLGDQPVSIACNRVYHPASAVQTDITYSAMVINPATGETENSIAFTGSSGNSIMYMSPDAIYITYSMPGDLVKFALNFFKASSGIVPEAVISRIEKLAGYDLSYYTKVNELSYIIDQYRSSLTDDDRLKFDNDINNKMQAYLEAHNREMDKTGIVKIGVSDFKVLANGSVPGSLLNQFSMDENGGFLRLASTIGQNGWWGLGFGTQSQSVNDVYVLDKDMKIAGSVKDLGKGERIYSVRFIEDKGYVVTYKQMDPFYVIDLSDPKNPAMKGELKIPGFSSYLHPIAKNIILGVGQENNQVKLSLFDVTDASNPTEISKYNLNEYWTEVSSNHHAFLQDAMHNIFFLPGGQGSYIFSYDGNNLKLQKAISGMQANRALYLNDYLYVVATDKITVLDEKTWEKVGEVDISK